MIGLGCGAVVVVALVIAMTLRRAQHTKPPPPPGPAEGALLPPQLPMTQAKMMPPPTQVRVGDEQG